MSYYTSSTTRIKKSPTPKKSQNRPGRQSEMIIFYIIPTTWYPGNCETIGIIKWSEVTKDLV
jgi:hypothetical protein